MNVRTINDETRALSKKVNNFQEEFSLQDIEIARDIKATYDCGMSRIALKAPDQIFLVYRDIMNEPDSASATIHAITLKMHYAIQVWYKAAIISAKNPGDLLYYWWIHWKTGDGPFNKLEYSNFYRDISVEQLLHWFWELLEKIADSGEIQVSEGYQFYSNKAYGSEPNIYCKIILDAETGKEIDKKVYDVFTYTYNKTPRSFKWKDIKDFFYEMSLDQMRLTMPDKLHNHTKLDDTLLQACSDWDVDQIQMCMKRGANINCLDESGESVLQKAVEYFSCHGMLIDEEYTKEEIERIEGENEQKCKMIVDLLLSYGADINLFGFIGMSPLVCAYYERNPRMLKFLLDRGASPNVNCYLEDFQYWPELKNVRSTILNNINDLIYEDYDDAEQENEKLIREAGGRQYVWDFTPWNYDNIGKYVVHMRPAYNNDDILFCDNASWKIGTPEQLTIEDENVNQTIIDLSGIKGLKQWHEDFHSNQMNPNYDWRAWKMRGLSLAKKVAKLLPDNVSLFYLYNNEIIVEQEPRMDKLSLCSDGDPIRIK